MQRLWIAASLLALALLAGCGPGPPVPPPVAEPGPFATDLAGAQQALARAGIDLAAGQQPAALAARSRPETRASASFRSRGGPVFDLLVYRSAKVALRARAGIRSAVGQQAGERVWIGHNVLLVLHRRGTDARRIRRVVARLGSHSP
jgi:hypothetical protein